MYTDSTSLRGRWFCLVLYIVVLLPPCPCLPAVVGVQLVVEGLAAGHQRLPAELLGALLPHRLVDALRVVLLLLLTARQRKRKRERERKKRGRRGQREGRRGRQVCLKSAPAAYASVANAHTQEAMEMMQKTPKIEVCKVAGM